MSKRLLFCVETTKQANTDYAYIRETIDHYYAPDKKTVLRSIPMNSKTRYNSNKVREEIRKQSGPKDTHVIYCIDTDKFDTSPEDKTLLEKIRQYCDSQEYDFVFFCRDVEDVYCGGSVPDTEKSLAIKRFRTTHAIEHMETGLLEKRQYQRHCSNILCVLDRYLTRVTPDTP